MRAAPGRHTGAGFPYPRNVGLQVEVIEGDITAQQVDVVVNAANSSLL